MQFLNKLRISPEIRFNLDQAKTYADKVFLLLQVAFGNVSLEDFTAKTENTSPLQTQMTIFNAAPRIARAIFAVACHRKYGGAALAALELLHTVHGKAWEDSPTIFRQIEKIGPKSITVLASNGISCELNHSELQLTPQPSTTLSSWILAASRCGSTDTRRLDLK